MAGLGHERAVDAVAVQEVGRQAVDEDVPDIAGLVRRSGRAEFRSAALPGRP